MYDLYVLLPIRLVTWLTCIGLMVIALPLVIFLRAQDATMTAASTSLTSQ